MSYTMDFESSSNISPEDVSIDYEDFKLVTDRQSIMFLSGVRFATIHQSLLSIRI